MIRKQFLLLLALLVTAATGAWAQSTTHVVTQSTVDDIFSGAGYTLGEAVKAGDVLDFQGTIDIDHSLVINKQVSITSYTEDAVISLHTEAGTLLGDAPGNSFVINKAGSGTTVKGIRLENTQTWLYNTSNVTFTGVTMWVDGAQVGSGVGQVSIRYSDHVTFNNCTVYTKDNGFSSGCVLTGSSNCIFKDTHFESVGNASNPLYLGNPYNTTDMPEDFDVVCHDCTLSKCTFSGVGNVQVMYGQRHIFDNCLFNISTSFGSSATEAKDGLVIRNNTFTRPLSLPKYSTVKNNTVAGNVTLSGTNVVFTGNQVAGKVTTSEKGHTITGNTIISTEAYAVSLTSTAADANNQVTGNVLMAAGRAGDDAVESKSASNIIHDNKTQATTADGLTWSYDALVNTLTIAGTGTMANYEKTTDGKHSTAPWAILYDKAERVVIGEGVTAIGQNAFYGFKNVSCVIALGTTPPTLAADAIDPQAAINSVYVPAGTTAAYQTDWSAYASVISSFMPCGPDGHETDMLALYDATTKTLTIAGTGDMADYASADDQPWASLQGDIQTVVIESTVTAVGQNAFAGCSALTVVHVEGADLTLGTGSFDGNAPSRKFLVPFDNVNTYMNSWPDYAPDIRTMGYCGAAGYETDVAWEYAPYTQSLTISGTGPMANYSNYPISRRSPWYSLRTAIESATVEQGVTAIGNCAFIDCTNLASVTIYAPSLTSYGTSAFDRNASGRKIYVPAASVPTYKAGWPDYADDIEEITYTVTFKALNDNTIESGKATVKLDGNDATISNGKLTTLHAGQTIMLKAAEGYKLRKVEVKVK